jgi:hypothetical protein
VPQKGPRAPKRAPGPIGLQYPKNGPWGSKKSPRAGPRDPFNPGQVIRNRATGARACWTFRQSVLFCCADFETIRNLFGMARGPCFRPWGVDSGPGEWFSRGSRGVPEPNINMFFNIYRCIYFLSLPRISQKRFVRRFLAPPPTGGPREGPDDHRSSKIGGLARFRPGSLGAIIISARF